MQTFKTVKDLTGEQASDFFEFAPVFGTEGNSLKLQKSPPSFLEPGCATLE